MIVFDGPLVGVEVGLVTSALGSGVDEVEQPRSAFGIADDVEVGVADHVHHHEGFDFFEGAVFLPFFGEMAGTVNTIGVCPLPYRFFAVGPDEPDAVAISLLSGSPAAQLVGVFEQNGSGGTAIVGSDE